jgi:hypothetical protein
MHWRLFSGIFRSEDEALVIVGLIATLYSSPGDTSNPKSATFGVSTGLWSLICKQMSGCCTTYQKSSL